MKVAICSFFFASFFLAASTLIARPTDSLRLEIDKNKKKAWIIHKVDAKETLFGLARRYNVSTDEIIKENPQAKNLRIGDILRIPYKDFDKQTVLTAPQKSNGKKHIVQSKETLFSISKLYKVSVSDLQQWNNLSDTGIKVGQEIWISKPDSSTPESKELKEVKENKEIKENKTETKEAVQTHIVKEDESPYLIAKKYKVKLTELLEWNGLSQDSKLQIGQKIEIYPSGYKKPEPNQVKENQENKEASPENKEENLPEITRQTITISGYSKIIEKGLAEVMEDEKAGNYTGLHRDAPIGTIVAVKNENNGESVFVRIVGKLPSVGNNKILIKVSKNVYEALGAKKSAFPVEVSYIP
ncbi:MAG: hypothetical protein OHK0045_04610 [Raineya sp.]